MLKYSLFKGEKMNIRLYKICYYISVFITILGLAMTAFSLMVVIPSFTTSSLIVPGAFLALTIIGIVFALYYHSKIKGAK